MATKVALKHITTRLKTLSLHLHDLRSCLQDNSEPIQQRIDRLNQMYQKLEAIQASLLTIEEMVMLRFGLSHQPSTYWNYLVLVELLEQMQHLTRSLMHLTEEYLIDPVGVQSCLQTEINFDVVELQNRFKQLTATDHSHLASRTPKDSAA